MTELVFKGKEFVYNHHLAVPYRPLKMDPDKGIGTPRLDGNLIVHGDNLEALKALLPLYAGEVDCIFIDPPYNTGKEDWSYNDNVRSPMIAEWLNRVVGIEDALRHDKWCSMMWPRLRLLHELLADHGTIWITLDDNEIHRARLMLDEIFGEERFISKIVVQTNKRGQTFRQIAKTHEYILVYGKSSFTALHGFDTEGENLPQEDRFGNFSSRELRNRNPKFGRKTNPNLYYPFYVKEGNVDEEGFHIASVEKFEEAEEVYPLNSRDEGSCWRWGKELSREKTANSTTENIFAGKTRSGKWRIYEKYRKTTVKAKTIWAASKHISEQGTRELGNLGLGHLFSFPKPLGLLEDVIDIATEPDALILDSFAGSGTTAHAVLEANKRDGGKRRFILVECEDYSDSLTAERIRRAIRGYDYLGKQKTELLREKITWTAIKSSLKLVESVEKMENLFSHQYDQIAKKVVENRLVVTGIKEIEEHVPGLGGEFTYCTLDEPLELDDILLGTALPSYESVGALFFHMATRQVLPPDTIREEQFYLGESRGRHVWMRYKPDLEWLKCSEAALTLNWAKEISNAYPDTRHLVLAPACFVSRKLLLEENIPVEFVPFPFALYRVVPG